jgi:SAM-dependent methyltransferase
MLSQTMKFGSPSSFLTWSFDQPMGDADATAHFRLYYHSFRRAFGPLRRRKYDLQLEELTQLVRSGEVQSVLDVGCGCGSVSLWLAMHGAKVTGIDLEAVRLRVAGQRAAALGVAADFKLTNLFEVEGKFDAIWIEQAFHHIEPRSAVWTKIASLLKPGGLVLICDTNGWNPLVQIQLFKRRGFKIHVEHVDDHGKVHVYADERITVPQALDAGFLRVGVRRIASRYFGVLPNAAWAEKIAFIEGLIPRVLVPLFTHYLWIGRLSADAKRPA